MADECPTAWDEYFVQPDGVIKCGLESIGAPGWTIVVVSVVFCFLAWRDFAGKRREEAGRVAAAVRASTSWMVRTCIRIGLHVVLLVVGAYLVARIGAGLYGVDTVDAAVAEILGTGTGGPVRHPEVVVWVLLGVVLLAVAHVWSAVSRTSPVNSFTGGLLGILGHLSMYAVGMLGMLGLIAFFGWGVPEFRHLSYTYFTWVIGWALVMMGCFGLSGGADTLGFILSRNHPFPARKSG